MSKGHQIEVSRGEEPFDGAASDLPHMLIVDQHGHYWRAYDDHYSMPAVSDENTGIEIVASYIRSTSFSEKAGVIAVRATLATPTTEGLDVEGLARAMQPHQHSMWECGRVKHVATEHWMDDLCTLSDDSEDRCRFAPYRNTRPDLRPPVPTTEGLDAAWAAAEAAVREHKPGAGFGVEADGPGYRAHAGHHEWHGGYAEAWSVDDPEIAGDPDTPASPAKALLRLAARLTEPR